MNKTSNKLLTIAVSTVSNNRDGVISYLLSVLDGIPDAMDFVVVSQMEDSEEVVSLRESLTLIKSPDKGLAKSRNVAINFCSAEWLWFQDDDINLLTESLPNITTTLNGFDGDVAVGKVLSLENKDEFFKDYSRYNVRKKFLPFRISSIEIFVRSSFLKDNNILFDENLGLGSSLPSCEENLFFYNMICRHGARYIMLDDPVCYHTTSISVRDIDFEGRYKARGYMLAKVASLFSIFIFSWWFIRPGNDEVSRLKRFRLMLAGAIIAYKGVGR